MPNQPTVTVEQLHEMGYQNTINEAVTSCKKSLETAYPDAVFYIVACEKRINPKTGKQDSLAIATKHGSQRDLSIETTLISASTQWLCDTCVETALNVITSHTPTDIVAAEAAMLHDAALDYAKWRGLDVSSREYCRDSSKWHDVLNPKKTTTEPTDPTLHRIGQKVTPLALEQHITQVREELKRLEGMRDTKTMHRMITDEIMRLKRKNELTAAKLLQADLDAYEAEQKHKEMIREIRRQQAAHAREGLAAKRERMKRERTQQPNFAKMAKRKRQEIAARQAEKKKKKASGGSSDNVRSCSQMLNHQ